MKNPNINRLKKVGRLHVLTDIKLQSRFSHVDLARLAIAGGADTIQYREKAGSTRQMIETALQMKRLCADAGIPLIVNDRIDIAIAAGADGVHLGQNDFPIPLARKLLGEYRLVGGSASTMKEAKKCYAEGVDYMGLGPINPTLSKEDAGPVIGADFLKQVIMEIPLPIVAIGGIGVQDIPELKRAGVHGIAVISSVCCHKNPEQATRALYLALHKYTSGERHV